MIQHSVFATNIFVEDDFIDKSISSDMKQYIEQMWTIREYDNNWQTVPRSPPPTTNKQSTMGLCIGERAGVACVCICDWYLQWLG